MKKITVISLVFMLFLFFGLAFTLLFQSESLHDRFVLLKTWRTQVDARYEGDYIIALSYPSQYRRDTITRLRHRYLAIQADNALYAKGAEVVYNLGGHPTYQGGRGVSRCNTEEIPAALSELSQLRSLIILGCDQIRVPPEIAQFEKLEKLTIHGTLNGGLILPPEIGQVKSLTRLDLRDIALNHLPSEIGQLQNLRYLDLSNLGLRALPAEIGQLQKLETLILSGNRLRELPPEIGQLKELKRLDLWGNDLRVLPPEFRELQKLNTLNLGDNRFEHWPPETTALNRLEKLNLSHNRVEFVPEDVQSLDQLKFLYLRQSGLTEVPPELNALPNLIRVQLFKSEAGEDSEALADEWESLLDYY